MCCCQTTPLREKKGTKKVSYHFLATERTRRSKQKHILTFCCRKRRLEKSSDVKLPLPKECISQKSDEVRKTRNCPSSACKTHHPIFTVQLSSSIAIFDQTVILGMCGLSLLLFVYEYNPLIVADRSSEKPIPQRLFTPKSRESRPTFEAIPRGQN